MVQLNALYLLKIYDNNNGSYYYLGRKEDFEALCKILNTLENENRILSSENFQLTKVIWRLSGLKHKDIVGRPTISKEKLEKRINEYFEKRKNEQ